MTKNIWIKLRKYSLWRFFCSIKFAITLLVLIILFSIIGTLIPQKSPDEEYISKLGLNMFNFLRYTQITNIFSSWWFISLLAILSVNILVCTIDRIETIVRVFSKPVFNTTTDTIKQLKFNAEIPVSGQTGIMEKIESILKYKKYKVAKKIQPDAGIIIANKGKISRIGSLVIHFSIILILIGGAFSAVRGIKYNLKLEENRITNLDSPKTTLRLNKFVVETYPNSDTPKAYKSYIDVIKNGAISKSAIVLVNHPLKIDDFTFYQSSYGMDPASSDFVLQINNTGQKTSNYIRLKAGQTYPFPDSNLSIGVSGFFPNFRIDEKGDPISVSDAMENPAIKLDVIKDGVVTGKTYLFLDPRFKKFHHTAISFKDQSIDVDFADVIPNYYSVLQVVKDPGVGIVYAGFIIVIAGVFLAFYSNHRSILIVNDNKTIYIGATSTKNLSSFEDEFNGIRDEIKMFIS